MPLLSVLIEASSLEQLLTLDRYALDLHHRGARRLTPDRFQVPAVLRDDRVAPLEADGFRVTVLSNLELAGAERLRDVAPANRYHARMDTAALAERTVLGGYVTDEEVETAIRALSTTHPDLVTLIELPHRSWEGRRSHAVRVRAGAATNRAGVLFTGSMHAREWGGSDICVHFLGSLVNAYTAKTALTYGNNSFPWSDVQRILETLDVFVFPDVNPDGKHYSQTHDPADPDRPWWRKNRNPNDGASAAGVDINRNFDFLWSSGIGTSSDPRSETYKGVAPFSEPETRNVRHLFETYPDIRYYVDVHSFGELILYSWGDDDNQSTDPTQSFRNPAYAGVRGTPGDAGYREYIPASDQHRLVELAQGMNAALHAVRGKSYTVQQAVGLYPTSATSDDYAFSRHSADASSDRIYAFTIEFGEEFVPPFGEMRTVILDVNAAMTEFCRLVSG